MRQQRSLCRKGITFQKVGKERFKQFDNLFIVHIPAPARLHSKPPKLGDVTVTSPVSSKQSAWCTAEVAAAGGQHHGWHVQAIGCGSDSPPVSTMRRHSARIPDRKNPSERVSSDRDATIS